MHVMPASNDLHHRANIDSESRRHGGAIEAASGRAPEIRFYMSGDLRAATGLSRTHLDFYLREGIVQSTARTESGYLLFDDAERDRLEAVIGWRRAGVSLREIRRRLGREPQPDADDATGDDR